MCFGDGSGAGGGGGAYAGAGSGLGAATGGPGSGLGGAFSYGEDAGGASFGHGAYSSYGGLGPGTGEQGRGGALDLISQVMPVVGGIVGLSVMGPPGIAIGTGLGKGLSSLAKGESLDTALATGALTGMASAVSPALALAGPAVASMGKGQPSDMATPGSMPSISGAPSFGGEAMMSPEQALSATPNPFSGPGPVPSLPTGPISASSLSVPGPKVNPLNLSNVMASRGIRGTGRVAPKKEWFERRV